VNQTARQVGGAIGVALLVVILGTPHTPAVALDNFRHLWWYAASMALLSGLACSLLRPGRATAPRRAPVQQVLTSSGAPVGLEDPPPPAPLSRTTA